LPVRISYLPPLLCCYRLPAYFFLAAPFDRARGVILIFSLNRVPQFVQVLKKVETFFWQVGHTFQICMHEII
jgi:hypothetical protein